MGRERNGTDGRDEAGRPATRAAVEEAYHEATRTATRASFLSAIGFGLSLVMVALLASGAGPARGYGLEHLLALGGAVGGVMLGSIAGRAARVAKQCERRLGHRE